MLENIYTTKMSANKKFLESRFTKISSRSSRSSKVMTLFMTVVVMITMLCANVVMAMVDPTEKQTHKIVITNNGQPILFDHQPFFQNKTAYIPLRELLEKCDLLMTEDSGIVWNNGEIYLTLSERLEEENSSIVRYTFKIEINNREIVYNPAAMLPPGKGQAEFTSIIKYAPVLKEGVTYIPFACVDAIWNRTLQHCAIQSCVWDLNYNRDIQREADYTNDMVSAAYSNYLFQSGVPFYDDYTTNRNNASSVLNTFLKALHREDYPKMTELCTQECIANQFVLQGNLKEVSVFGIHKANATMVSYGYTNEYTDFSNRPIIVTLSGCEYPADATENLSEQKWKVYFEKQSDGTFLICAFSH